MPDAIRQNSTLSPVQAQVIAALAAGQSITDSASAAGVHRSTIQNWLRAGEQFRTEFDKIRQETVDFLRDQLAGLERSALVTLKSLMEDPSTPASVRLKAALAVLQRPQFPNQTWSLPERVESLAQQKVVDQFALAMAASAGEPAAPQPSSAAMFVPRNAPCPCSSGEKYKRCCGKNAPPHLDPGLRAVA